MSANSGSYNISTYSISSSTGALDGDWDLPDRNECNEHETIPVGRRSLRHGDWFARGDSGLYGHVTAYSVRLRLRDLHTSPGTIRLGLAITPNGGFLYTANKVDNSISEFTINSGWILDTSRQLSDRRIVFWAGVSC
jgi:DNA-binding beta-propeller fold protein YncE